MQELEHFMDYLDERVFHILEVQNVENSTYI